MSDRTRRTIPAIPRSRLWWLRRLALVAVAIVALTLLTVLWVVPAIELCAPGVHRVGNECVGMTDGSFLYDSSLEQVERRIHDENAWVDRQRDAQRSNQPALHVSVAYLAPMTLTGADSLTRDELRHELEGAYVAQFVANHPKGIAEQDDGQRPLIRLLVANSGSQSKQWRTAVEEIEARRAAPDSLVAVAGLGPSLSTTRAAIDQLSGDRIPMVGATITADDLAGIRGLVRVSPTNTREAQAGAEYAKTVLKARRVLLVKDSNQQDLYASSLAKQFNMAAQQQDLVELPSQQYSSDLPGPANIFPPMIANICFEHPDVIYFAGRAREMQFFLIALGARVCPDQPFAVLTGDDASGLVPNAALSASLSNLSVYYTGLAHPDDWIRHPSTVSAIFGSTFKGDFPNERLDDGDAIMAHDAVLTVVTAIRDATGAPAKTPVDPGQVIQRFNVMSGKNAVQGASGLIDLDSRGNATNKLVVFLRLDPNGMPQYKDRSS